MYCKKRRRGLGLGLGLWRGCVCFSSWVGTNHNINNISKYQKKQRLLPRERTQQDQWSTSGIRILVVKIKNKGHPGLCAQAALTMGHETHDMSHVTTTPTSGGCGGRQK